MPTDGMNEERIAGDVYSELSVDRDRLRGEVSARFEGGTWNDLIEGEKTATAVVEDAWGELAFDCGRALADVHELYLVQAERVLEAQRELERHGSESWIARAVINRIAAQLTWDLLDERGLLTEF